MRPQHLRTLLTVLAGTLLSAQDPGTRPESRPGSAAAGAGTKPSEIPIPSDQEGNPVLELTVEDALRLGRGNNTKLRADELAPFRAREVLREAHAFFEPELYGEIGASRTKDPSRNIFAPGVTRETYDSKLGWRQRVATGGLFDIALAPTRVNQSVAIPGFPSEQYMSELNFSVTQPLLRGFGTDYTLRNVRIAEAALAGSEQRFDRSIQQTLLEIVVAYWELVFARENYRVVFQSYDLAREQLRITNERIRVRELAERDRIADEAEVARRQEELITAENQIRAREDNLRRLLFDDREGLLWRRNLRPTSGAPQEPSVPEIDWRVPAQTALRERPDLKALRADVTVAELQLLAAERDVLPRLDLVGSYGTDGTRSNFPDAWNDSMSREWEDWSVRLQLAVPLGNQAALAARDRSKIFLEERQRLLYAGEMDAAKEVRLALRELNTNSLRIRASRESVRLAETNLDTERQKLRVGLSTIFEVQRRNQELQEARSRLVRAEVDYRIAEAGLLYAQGRLLPPKDRLPSPIESQPTK